MAPKKAIIVESPTKTRTLSGFLGDEYKLLASMGHVRDLPDDDMGVDLEGDFSPTYVVSGNKTIKMLKKELKDVEEIYLAMDPDREGEAIAWHILDELGLDSARRIQFNEITQEAVAEALRHPGELNMDRVDAQQARRILDRLVGYSISPVLWKKIGGGRPDSGLSAGRVQSVALRLITDRERERAAFDPEEWWSISALLQPEGRQQIEADLKTVDGEEVGRDLEAEEQVTPLVEELREATYTVAEIEETEQKRQPQPPFITSTLQRAASNRLRFSARKTMRIAQQLYEGVETAEGAHGLITYMRTDSTNVAAAARKQAGEFIEQKWGEKYVGPGAKGKKVKGAQEAHEAIRPTSVTRTPESLKSVLSKDQMSLYELIWRRFVASQMSPAIVNQTGVNVEAGRMGLRATGQVVVFPGWYAVMPRDDEDKSLPELTEGEELELVEVTPEQHFTQPPPRYTEASLVRELEANGVGRPSTYADIIDTLTRRRYVATEKRQFVPTPLGLSVSDYLVENFPEIMDIEFTAHIEEDLDTVERGERDWREVLKEFYEPFEGEVEAAESAEPKVLEDQVCEECGGRMLVKYSKRGKFAGCENYPDCTFTIDLSGDVLERPPVEETDFECPECGKSLLLRTGRRGRFFGCSGYPECRYTADVGPEGAPKERAKPMETDESCPECEDGVLLVREGRRGKFLGCSNYPSCRYTRDYEDEAVVGEASEELASPNGDATDSNAVPVSCPKCGGPMSVRRGGRGSFLGCNNYPECKGTRPISDAIAAGWEPPAPEKLGEECPECGKDLVIREGRRGKFVGCSAYPKCRYTRDYEEDGEGSEAE
ncbi:MAG: type I DNA topoisomerase [Armatimonadota bacterium]